MTQGHKIGPVPPYGEVFEVAREQKKVLFIFDGETRARNIFDLFSLLYPDRKKQSVLFLPWDVLPELTLSPSTERVESRLLALHRLTTTPIRTVFSTYSAIVQPFASMDNLGPHMLRVGDQQSPQDIATLLHELGYSRTEAVEGKGTYALRGDLLEVWPLGSAHPYRLSFFDIEVESILRRDISDTWEPVESVEFYPIREICYPSTWCMGVEAFLPERCPKLTNLSELFTPEVWMGDPLEDCRRHFEAMLASLPNPPVPGRIVPPNIPSYVALSSLHKGRTPRSRLLRPPFVASHRWGDLVTWVREESRRRLCILFSSTPLAREAFMGDWKAQTDFPIRKVSNAREAVYNALNVAVGPTERVLADEKLILIAEQVFRGTPPSKRRRDFARALDIGLLREGDHVVHVDYGVGRYEGLSALRLDHGEQEFLTLTYRDGDKLYVPILAANKLYRYGGEAIALDKLGQSHFVKRKEKIMGRVALKAAELVDVAARRRLQKAPHMERTEIYDRFVEGFPHVETEDQERTELEVLEDLKSGHPMDRLVCGDAGYGKTEIALRAAACTLFSGYQVALVTPTTILAKQHYETFSHRFRPFEEIEVAFYSRLAKTKDRERLQRSLPSGRPQLLIGTSGVLRLRQWKHLGLLIVDEEQNFGLVQKEALKALFPSLHILTMSATPIPRTMQLALQGVKELSLVTIAPHSRRPVATAVIEEKAIAFRAIERELERGGQVFCVVPRIEDIESVVGILRKINPTWSLAVLYGSMSSNTIEDTLGSFLRREISILVSTNIVESGLDMPNVNTVVVWHAERFGLGQLYQLRGRVGRSNVPSYCYYLVRPDVGEKAKERLGVLAQLGSHVTSYAIASEDLELRGSGSIVGVDQSGVRGELGMELYRELLQEALERAKEERVSGAFVVTVDLRMEIGIPSAYVKDEVIRAQLYRQLASIREREDVLAFGEYMRETFGELPAPVACYLETLLLRPLCREVGVQNVEGGRKGIFLRFFRGSFAEPMALLHYVHRHGERLKVIDGRDLFLRGPWESVEDLLSNLRHLLFDLKRMLEN